MDAKTCTGCGKTKPLASFHVDNRDPSGRKNICKVCRMNEGKAAKKHQPTSAPRAGTPPAPTLFADDAVSGEGGAPDARQDDLLGGVDLNVEAPDAPGEAGKPSGGLFADLMDAMKGTTPAGGPKPPKSVRDEQEAMSAQMATGAGFLLHLGSTIAIPNPYKPCAPTSAHGYAITKPLAEILAEKMDVAGHLSPTMVRLAESGMALLMYGDYAIRMYLTIREQEMHRAASPHAASPSQPGPAGYPVSAPAPYADASTLAGGGQLFAFQASQPEGSGAGQDARNHPRPNRQVRHRAGQPGASGGDDTAAKAAAVDALFAADAAGRRQLGLVG